MLLVYLFYLVVFVWAGYFAYSKYLDKIREFDVNEKMKEVKTNNVIVSKIREFQSEYDTSDKKSEINNFVS